MRTLSWKMKHFIFSLFQILLNFNFPSRFEKSDRKMRFSLVRNVKFAPQIKELRIHLCQSSSESQGARWASNSRLCNNFSQLNSQLNVYIIILVNLCKNTMWASNAIIQRFPSWCVSAAACSQDYGLVSVSWPGIFSRFNRENHENLNLQNKAKKSRCRWRMSHLKASWSWSRMLSKQFRMKITCQWSWKIILDE